MAARLTLRRSSRWRQAAPRAGPGPPPRVGAAQEKRPPRLLRPESGWHAALASGTRTRR